MSLLTAVAFVVGVVGLVVGAEWLVRGAARLAARTGLSAIVIGLTVVAFGTSAPELAVSLGAALGGESDIALGNVVGSNIANILLVLGLSAVAGGGLYVAQRIVRIDVPIMIAVSAAVLLLGLDGRLGRIDGALLTVTLVTYITWLVVANRREASSTADEDHDDIPDAVELEEEYSEGLSAGVLRAEPVWRDLLFLVAGLGLLVVGAQALVGAATDIATSLGVSELVIGLTVVAVGTSLPEIATSVIAAARGQRDLAVGNAIGSNLFNIMAVLGISSIITPIGVSDSALGFDLPFMLAVAVACLPMFVNGFVLKRWEGAVFLGYYVAYLVWLGLKAAENGFEGTFSLAMLGFVVPITALTLAVVGWRGWSAWRAGTIVPHA
jgi:cation:H+ antiporter